MQTPFEIEDSFLRWGAAREQSATQTLKMKNCIVLSQALL